MKIMVGVSKIKSILVGIISTFSVYAQVNQKEVKEVVAIMISKELKKHNASFLLENVIRYDLVKNENANIVRKKEDISFCSKRKILKINNKYIQDTICSDWSKYSFEYFKIISNTDANQIYKKNKELANKTIVITMVNPIFSPNKKKCLINISYKQGKNKGTSILIFLKRKKNKWTIKKRYSMLVA